VQEEYKTRHYRRYLEAKTIEEFAKALMKLDAQGGS
jgi:ribosomal protein S10